MTQLEKDLMDTMRNVKLRREDAVAICIYARRANAVQILLDFVRQDPTPDSSDVLNYAYDLAHGCNYSGFNGKSNEKSE